MKSDVSIAVVDNGLFPELAIRLARDCTKPVGYYSPWECEFPTILDRAIGDGFGEIRRVEDILSKESLDRYDLFVFPDLFHGGKQEVLRRLGKLVWGSNTGDWLETQRLRFRQWQARVGLPVPEYTVVKGVEKLRAFLQEREKECWMKTTCKLRGTMETWKHCSWEESKMILDDLSRKLGPYQDFIVFLVEEPIDAEWETGFDTYCIDGQWPEVGIQGIEIKGKFMLASAQINTPIPKILDEAMTALSDPLREDQYRNFISAEFRDDKMIDPCCRGANPGLTIHMEMMSNLVTILLDGAQGHLVEPEFECRFGMQAAIFSQRDPEVWKSLDIPTEVRHWVKLMELCRAPVNGKMLLHSVPRPPHGTKVGWLCGMGNTIEECAEQLYENAEYLKNLPVDICLDEMHEAIAQAKKSEEQNQPFSDKPVPKPDQVQQMAESAQAN